MNEIVELCAKLVELENDEETYRNVAAKIRAITPSEIDAATGQEAAWFIERRDDRSFPARPYTRWLKGFDYEEPLWTNDPLEAIRFCRKDDAANLCWKFGIPEVQRYSPFPTEHIFLDAAPVDSSAPVCTCGSPTTLGVVHRADRPCFLYTDDPMPEPLDAEKKLSALYVAWLTGDPAHLVMVAANTFQPRSK